MPRDSKIPVDQLLGPDYETVLVNEKNPPSPVDPTWTRISDSDKVFVTVKWIRDPEPHPSPSDMKVQVSWSTKEDDKAPRIIVPTPSEPQPSTLAGQQVGTLSVVRGGYPPVSGYTDNFQMLSGPVMAQPLYNPPDDQVLDQLIVLDAPTVDSILIRASNMTIGTLAAIETRKRRRGVRNL